MSLLGSTPPEASDLIAISDKAFNRQQLLPMEKTILNNMEWNLTVPTPYHFLLPFAKAAGRTDKEFCSLCCPLHIEEESSPDGHPEAPH